jgi:hypothetical protein
VTALVAAVAAGPSTAQDAPREGAVDDEALATAANDPTASLTAFLLQNFYPFSYHILPGADGTRVQFRTAIPFELGGVSNIARLTLPYVTDGPTGNEGLADATLFDLATSDRSWGRFGVGTVALLPTGADDVGAEKWGLGPAGGFVAQRPWGSWGRSTRTSSPWRATTTGPMSTSPPSSRSTPSRWRTAGRSGSRR